MRLITIYAVIENRPFAKAFFFNIIIRCDAARYARNKSTAFRAPILT